MKGQFEKLTIKERIINKFIDWLGKHYPMYWEITTVYQDGHQSISHKICEQDDKQSIKDRLDRDAKEIAGISMITAEQWVNIKGLGIRIELENTKISVMPMLKLNIDRL